MRFLLREREQLGSYTGSLFKLPSDRVVTPEKFQAARTGIRLALPSSEARTQPTELSDNPLKNKLTRIDAPINVSIWLQRSRGCAEIVSWLFHGPCKGL